VGGLITPSADVQFKIFEFLLVRKRVRFKGKIFESISWRLMMISKYKILSAFHFPQHFIFKLKFI
jgi:hypothetical protein